MTFDKSELIELKDNLWFERQKVAGKCVAAVLKSSEEIIAAKPQNLSLKDLESNAIKIIKEHGCSATFLGYKNFPSAICVSVNKHVVHGIVTDYILQDGDVISVDLGATYEGAIGDAAKTFIYGDPKSQRIVEMLSTCEKALEIGIGAIKQGNRLGAIGNAIHKYCKDKGFGLIDKYGGHGINYNKPHAAPFVSNKSNPNEGPRFCPGMSLAIEPMLVLNGNTKTNVLNDHWTVEASDIACHFEHSIFIDKDFKVHIMTN